MTISISEVENRSELKQWVQFPLGLYRGDPNYVPQLTREEMDFFSPSKNPSFKIADTKLLLCRNDDRIVGRVCGIIHKLEAEKLGFRRGRFGWFESVDDPEVVRTMFSYLEDWFRRIGCREMTGPHGFSDLDPEGMLVEGFEWLPTIAGSYNKPNYPVLIEALGFQKEVDYIETRLEFPQEMPPLFQMIAKKVIPAAQAEGYRLVEGLGKKGVMQYAGQFWDLLEASFAQLYGVTPLTDEQKAFYKKKYFGFIDPRFLQLALDDSGTLQGFFLGLPSLSRSFQLASGRLFPFGFFHILRGFKRFDTVDFYFAGVHPRANPKKILPMMTLGMWRALKAANVRYLETNRELETNTAVVNIWSRFNVVNKRRTRIFRKELNPSPNRVERHQI
jgi:hypothetical protein